MLTVVIPSYNHALYIDECLRAALRINVPGMKVLIVDDGSSDNTLEIIDKFISMHPNANIQAIEKTNSGLISSLNMALGLAETEFIYFCASDDIPVSTGIEEAIKLMVSNEKLKFIIGGANTFSNAMDEAPVYGFVQEHYLNMDKTERIKASFFNYPSPLLIQSSIFRTQAIRHIGGWDVRMILDDYPFFIKMLQEFPSKKTDFDYLPNLTIVKYRQHSDNSYRNIIRQFKMVSVCIDLLAPKKYRTQAMSNCAAGYLLTALRRRRWRDAIGILRSVSVKVTVLLPVYVISRVHKKVKVSI